MRPTARSQRLLARRNIASARALWSTECAESALAGLRELTTRFSLSVPLGEVRLIDGTWYITHSGLVRLAQRRRCSGIRAQAILPLCDPSASRWVFKATVYKAPGSKGFVGYGDADPSNTSPLVRGAEMRVAETRAVNRALRKAYGIGLCSVEELGWLSGVSGPAEEKARKNQPPGQNSSGNGQPRLRDRLCLLIRQHQLDPILVKRYAAEFCGTAELRDASRGLVEEFIQHLAEWAARDPESLRCKLNSYAHPEDVKP
jgi:hypothetical protein